VGSKNASFQQWNSYRPFKVIQGRQFCQFWYQSN